MGARCLESHARGCSPAGCATKQQVQHLLGKIGENRGLLLSQERQALGAGLPMVRPVGGRRRRRQQHCRRCEEHRRRCCHC